MFTIPVVRMYFNGLLVHDEELHDSCLQMALGAKWGGDRWPAPGQIGDKFMPLPAQTRAKGSEL